MPVDPVDLTARLVRCASVTPANEGALEILEELLSEAGFECSWADRGGIRNLFARWGARGNGRAFGFNGHTDVVPIGREADWSMPPFGAREFSFEGEKVTWYSSQKPTCWALSD